MSVGVETLPTNYIGDGVTTRFPLGFSLTSPGDLRVRLNLAVQSGGVTPVDGDAVFDVAPAVGVKVELGRATPRAQDDIFPANGRFPSDAYAIALDRLTRTEQEQDAALGAAMARSVLVPDGETAAPLPAAAARAGLFLGFDSSGNPVPVQGTTNAPANGAQIASPGGDSLGDAVETQRFATVAAMLASTIQRRSAGRPWRAAGYAYVEAPAGVLDYHLVTAGGVLLYALAVNGAVPGEAFGAIGDGVMDCAPALTRAVQLAKRVRLGVGAFNIGASSLPFTTDCVLLGEGEATQILWSGTEAVRCRAGQGTTGAAMFSTFAYRLVVRGINFVRSAFSTSASAIYVSNVRGLWVEDCFYSNSRLLMVLHEAADSGVYDTSTGSTTVDPAVVAGFSNTDLNDLNEHIYVRRNVSRNTQYGCQGARINWARYGEISGNHFQYGNISWWGGGARQDQGGQPGMLRRFANFRIFGNYCSWNNGSIYGNNGIAVIAEANTLEYSIDTALDFEGCIDCHGVGNTIRHFGNYACSTFYLARNISFRANTIECTVAGASAAASLFATTNSTSFMQSVATTAFADSGDGGTLVTLTTGPDIVSGQTALLQTAPGGARQTVTVTKVSTLVYRVNLPFGSFTPGGNFTFQRGRVFFCATAGLGVDTAGTVKGEVIFDGNTVGAYDGIMGTTQDTQIETIEVSNNKLTNCRIALTYGTGDLKIVTDNIMKFRHAVGSYAAGWTAGVPEFDPSPLIDVQGYTKVVVNGNLINLLNNGTWVPAGTYAMNVVTARQSNTQIMIEVQGNKLTRVQAANVTDGLNHSSRNTLIVGAAARISDNLLPTIVDSSPAGQCRSSFAGNMVSANGTSADKLAIAPTNGATVQLQPNHRAVYLTHNATLAALTIALPVDPADEATFRIVTKSAVTALTVTNASTGAPATIGAPPASLAAGDAISVRFSITLNAWIWG